jgi:hypothetical protein
VRQQLAQVAQQGCLVSLAGCCLQAHQLMQQVQVGMLAHI